MIRLIKRGGAVYIGGLGNAEEDFARGVGVFHHIGRCPVQTIGGSRVRNGVFHHSDCELRFVIQFEVGFESQGEGVIQFGDVVGREI